MAPNRAKRLIYSIYHCFTEDIAEASTKEKQPKIFDKLILRYHTEDTKKHIFYPNFLKLLFVTCNKVMHRFV